MIDHCLFDELRSLREAMVRQQNGVKSYRLISDFSKSSMSTIAEEMSSPLFRPFVPYKPASERMLNRCYDPAFNPLNHTLMDYPTIISAKLGASLDRFNRLVSVHVSGCPLHCWHCYVDECLLKACGRCVLEDTGKCKQYGQEETPYVTASTVIEAFIRQREIDQRKNPPVYTNVLRITGGEPLLVPDLIHECLQLLDKHGLNNDVFLWTETNLIPLLKNPMTGKPFAFDWGLDLEDLAGRRNLAIHPCIHGISSDAMHKITRHRISLDELLGALHFLIKANVDIYPTFLTTTNPPDAIRDLFKKIRDINPQLPLKFALVKHDPYPPAEERKAALNELGIAVDKYNHREAVETWEGLLQETYKLNYGTLPRHLIPCQEKEKIDVINERALPEELIFFKSSFRPEYVDALAQAVSLPLGWQFQASYDVNHLCTSVREQLSEAHFFEDRRALFVFVDCHAKPNDPTWARRFRPFRSVKIKRVEYREGSSWVTFLFQLGPFLIPKDTWERASDEICARFPRGVLPNEEHASYVLPAPKLLWTIPLEEEIARGWEKVVDSLSSFPDLQCIPFFTVDGLRNGRGKTLPLYYPLRVKAGRSYVLLLSATLSTL